MPSATFFQHDYQGQPPSQRNNHLIILFEIIYLLEINLEATQSRSVMSLEEPTGGAVKGPRFCCPFNKSGGLMQSGRTELEPRLFEKLLDPAEWLWILKQLFSLDNCGTYRKVIKNSQDGVKIPVLISFSDHPGHTKSDFIGLAVKNDFGMCTVFQPCTCVCLGHKANNKPIRRRL